GLGQFETRTWPGWHRHVAQTSLANLFLVRLQTLPKKGDGADRAQSSLTDRQALEVETDRLDPLAELFFHLQRNQAAYRSHRQRTREHLRRPATRRRPKSHGNMKS